MQTSVVGSIQKAGCLGGKALPIRILGVTPRVRTGMAVKASAAQAGQPLVVKVRRAPKSLEYLDILFELT